MLFVEVRGFPLFYSAFLHLGSFSAMPGLRPDFTLIDHYTYTIAGDGCMQETSSKLGSVVDSLYATESLAAMLAWEHDVVIGINITSRHCSIYWS